MIEESEIVFGYLWPNQYYKIDENLIVHTLSGGSSHTWSITLVDPKTPKLTEVQLPPSPIPGITDFNCRTEALCQRIEDHNHQIRELPLTPEQQLKFILTWIWSRENLDQLAFLEGNITYWQLWRIDQLANPQFYTEASLLEDTDYEPPHIEEAEPQGEEEEEEEEHHAYTRPNRNPLEDPAFWAKLSRAITGEIERITGQTPWNDYWRDVPIPWIRLDREEAREQLPQGPGAPIIRAVPDAEHHAILLNGLVNTRRYILNSFFAFVAINIILNFLLHHLVYIRFFWEHCKNSTKGHTKRTVT